MTMPLHKQIHWLVAQSNALIAKARKKGIGKKLIASGFAIMAEEVRPKERARRKPRPKA